MEQLSESVINFQKLDTKQVLETKAKLDILETLSVLVNSFRESLTRELVINDIKDPKKLEKICEDCVVNSQCEKCDAEILINSDEDSESDDLEKLAISS